MIKTRSRSPAQLIETVHCYEDSLRRVEWLLQEGVRNDSRKARPTGHGRGVGAVEVPRGTLYHEYDIGEDGRIRHANCIIPTGQNLAHIEKSMREMLPMTLDRSPEEMTLRMEMLVRAYDPCISCSTHFLKVDFADFMRWRRAAEVGAEIFMIGIQPERIEPGLALGPILTAHFEAIQMAVSERLLRLLRPDVAHLPEADTLTCPEEGVAS